jgi:ferrous iron transport protein B
MALHAWLRLKGFVFGAGKIIVVVVAVLGLVNSLGTDGTFGNQHSEKSVLSVIGKQITPVFAPIGVREENWPATVGLFTGIFAKEVVVGTLNALYAQQAAGDGEEEAFDFWGQVGEALASIPANLKGVTDLLLDPLGLSAATGSREEVAADQEVHSATFGAMARLFGGKVAAFAYMLFVLLYFPCAATFGAIAREIGLRWALFAALWSTWLGWFAAASFYQAATFAQHPASSAMWLVALGLGMIAVIWMIRMLGNRAVLTPVPAE